MPSWRDLRRFCEKDKWELYKDTDHYFYRKYISAKGTENGEVKRVKISKGSGEIHGHLWQEILKKQLKVTLEYFNSKI